MPELRTGDHGVALYYPHIHFQDTSWLKAALLYWDRIRRIVPVKVRTDDQVDVKRAVEAGLVLDIGPAEHRGEASARFEQDFFPALRAGGPLVALAVAEVQAAAPAHADCGLVDIHIEKMLHMLAGSLSQVGLLTRKEDQWYSMPRVVGAAYMFCLARTISESLNAPPVTDVPGYDACFRSLSTRSSGRHSTQSPDLAIALWSMDLRYPSPEELSQVPMKKILTFHKERSEERRRFRAAVETVLQALSGLDDRRAQEDFLSERKREIKSALRDYRMAKRELGLHRIVGSLKSSWPGALAAGVARAHNFHALAAAGLAGLGIAVSITSSVLSYRRERRQLAEGCPWQYLLLVQSRFGSHRGRLR